MEAAGRQPGAGTGGAARNTSKPGVSVQAMGDYIGPGGGQLAKLGQANRRGTLA